MAKRKKRPKGADGEPPHAEAPHGVTPPPDVRQRPFADALRGVVPAPPKKEPERSPKRTAEPRASSPAAPRPVGGPTGYDYGDRAAFQQAFADVKPLAGPRSRRIVTARVPAASPADDAAARARLDALACASERFEVEREDERVRGRRAGAHPSVLRELDRYDGPEPETLDLHGVRASDARGRVTRFVRDAERRGLGTVLVVHGKGRHSDAGGPVLRDVVIEALTSSAGAHVLAFASAPPRLGGEGATLVRLGRR